MSDLSGPARRSARAWLTRRPFGPLSLDDTITENSCLFYVNGYSRENDLEGYRLRGLRDRLRPDHPDTIRDRASWARDARH